jgi:hypothetical protein
VERDGRQVKRGGTDSEEGGAGEGRGRVYLAYIHTEYGDGSTGMYLYPSAISSCALMTHNLHPIRDLLISLVLEFCSKAYGTYLFIS